MNECKRLSDCPADRLAQCRGKVVQAAESGQWKMVPVIATEEMIRFANVAVPKTPNAQWNAMLAAAPVPPAGDVPEYFVAACDKFDWTPEEALRFYAEGKHFDTVGGRTRILCTGAIASHALKGLAGEYADMKGIEPAGDVEVLAVVALGGYFSSEELGDIDIQPRLAALEQIQQDVVRTDADEHLELVDRAHVTRLQAEVSALQQRLNIADQRVCDLTADLSEARRQVQLLNEAGEFLDQVSQGVEDNLRAELTKAREALAGMVEYFPEGNSDGECFSVERAKAVLAHQSAPAAKGGE